MHNASPARAAPTLAAPAADEAVIRRVQAEGYSDCTPTANINQCKLLGFSDGRSALFMQRDAMYLP